LTVLASLLQRFIILASLLQRFVFNNSVFALNTKRHILWVGSSFFEEILAFFLHQGLFLTVCSFEQCVYACVCVCKRACGAIILPRVCASFLLSPSQAGKLFDELDADGSGTLTKSEVGLVGSMKGVWSRSKKPKEDNGSSSSSPSKANKKSPSAKELFDMLDGDHDGSLTREEVYR